MEIAPRTPPFASALVEALTKNAMLEIASTAAYKNATPGAIKTKDDLHTFSASALSSDALEACAVSGFPVALSEVKDTHGNSFTASFLQTYNRRLSSLRQHALEFIEGIYCVNDYILATPTNARDRHEREEILIEHTNRALCQSFPLVQFELNALASMVSYQVTCFNKVATEHVYPGDLASYRNVDVSSLSPAAPMAYLDLVAPQRLFQDTLQVFMESEALLRSRSRGPSKSTPLFVGSHGLNGPVFNLFGSVSSLTQPLVTAAISSGKYVGSIAEQTCQLLQAAVKLVGEISPKHAQLGTPCASTETLEAALLAFRTQSANASGALFATKPILTFDTTQMLDCSPECLKRLGNDDVASRSGSADRSVLAHLSVPQEAAVESAAPVLQLQLQHVQSLVGFTRTNMSKCTSTSELGCAQLLNAALCHVTSLMQMADYSYRVGHFTDVASTVHRIRSEIENSVMPAITSSSNVLGVMKAWSAMMGAEESEAIACSAHIKELLPLKVKTTFAKFVAMHTLSTPVSHFSIDGTNNNICFNVDSLFKKTISVGGLKYRKNHQYMLYNVYAQGIVDEVAAMQASLMSSSVFKSSLLFARNSSQPFFLGLEYADSDSGEGSEDRPMRLPAAHSTYFNLTSWKRTCGGTPLFSPADFSLISVVRLVAVGMSTRTFVPSNPTLLRGSGSCIRVAKCPASTDVTNIYKVENRPVSAATTSLSLSLPSSSISDRAVILSTVLETAASLRPFTLAPVDYSVASSILLVGGGSREFLRYACLLALLSADASDLDKRFCHIPEIRTLLKKEAALLLQASSAGGTQPHTPVSLEAVAKDMVAGKFAAPLKALTTDNFVRNPFTTSSSAKTTGAEVVLGVSWENVSCVASTYSQYSPLYWRSMPLLSSLLKEHVITRAVTPYAALALDKLAFGLGMSVGQASESDDGEVDVVASSSKAVAVLEEQLKSLILARRLPPSTKIDRAAGCVVRAAHTYGGNASGGSAAAAAATAAVANAMIEGQSKALEEVVSSAVIKGYLEIGCMRGPAMVGGLKKSWERRSQAQSSSGGGGGGDMYSLSREFFQGGYDGGFQ